MTSHGRMTSLPCLSAPRCPASDSQRQGKKQVMGVQVSK